MTGRRKGTDSPRATYMDEVREALDAFEKHERDLRTGARREREQFLTEVLETSEARRNADAPLHAPDSSATGET